MAQIAGVSRLAKAFEKVDSVQFVGVSVDPDKGDAEGFLKKIGTAMPEIYIDKLEVRLGRVSRKYALLPPSQDCANSS